MRDERIKYDLCTYFLTLGVVVDGGLVMEVYVTEVHVHSHVLSDFASRVEKFVTCCLKFSRTKKMLS